MSAEDVPDVRLELNKYRKINRNSGGGTSIYNASYRNMTMRPGALVPGVGGYGI